MTTTYIVYQQGIGITAKPTQIESRFLDSAKKEAVKLFPTKGRWSRTVFDDINGVKRKGWVKGQAGIEYGNNPRIYMYEEGGETL